MDNRREIIAIGLTMLVSFCISLAVMLWQRKAEDLVGMPQPRPATPLAGQTRVLQEVPIVPVSKVVAVTQPAVNPATAANPDTASDDPPAAMLPLSFNLWLRGERHKVKGVVHNLMTEPMALTIRAVSEDAQKTSQIQLNLGPGEERPFSNEDGLAMSSRDTVVFHSPPYQDLSTRVP